jgi:hypothetical protein
MKATEICRVFQTGHRGTATKDHDLTPQFFFLPMFAFVTRSLVADRQLFDFAMIVDVLF